MSAETNIILTTLPKGVDLNTAGTTVLLLSVFITPRLMMPAAETDAGETRLDKFDDFENWPQTLSKLRFRVNIDGNTIEEPNGVVRAVVPQQSERWQALFPNPQATVVRPYNFADDDMSEWIVISYPVMNVIEFIKDRYGNGGAKQAAPTRCSPQVLPRMEHPAMARLFGPEWFGPITTQSRASARAKLNAQLQANGAYLSGKTPDPPVDFLQVADFHPAWHYSKTDSDNPSPPLDETKQQPPDFHELVSSLGEFPEVMRRVGLIVDLKIQLQIAPQNMPQSGRISVSFANAEFKPKIVSPFTRYRFDATRQLFIAAPGDIANAAFSDGLLKLDDAQAYGIAQVDVDGAAIKGMNFVEQMLQAASNPSIDTQGKAPLPSLRSGGISLVRTNHAAELTKTLADAKAYNQRAEQGEEITLAAEDLINGYRVDVREIAADGKPGPWRSLCRRQGAYQFHNNAALSFNSEDEGMASVGVTEPGAQPPPGQTAKRVKLSEMLFRWSGWSLTVPKEVCSENSLSGVPNELKTSFGFTASFSLPSTSGQDGEQKRLPRLRFGNRYQLRVRTVDLAGNSLTPEDSAEITTKEAVTYGRFEPVGWPTVILREAVTSEPVASGKTVPIKGKEGESVDRMVVRSRLDTNFDAPVIKSDRHVVPARISQEMAETHGMFDNADGTGLSKACFQMIDEKKSQLPKVLPEAQVKLPYLPEPLARGVTFLGLPGQDTFQVSYWPKGTKWPDLKPFRLEVVAVASQTAAKGAPALPSLEPPVFSESDTERVLTVRLPQAETARVRLSSFLSNDYGQAEVNDANKLVKKLGSVLNKLGVWHWVEEWITQHGTDSAETESWKHIARLLVLSGLHPIFTPYRDLVLVHAVKQPLLEPNVQQLKAEKVTDPPFATYALLSGDINCDGKSTGKLDVLAEWQEPRDDPREPQPHASPTQLKLDGMLPPVESNAHVFEVPINLPEIYINQQDLLQKQLLKHGERALGVIDVGKGIVTLTGKHLRHEFGDTKHRRVNYTALATTRFREYFEPSNPQTADERAEEQKNFARVSEPVSLRILSSARPEAPRVLYIIPAFRWERSPAASKRHGGGLRVYMERGWYSSGDREMLGVVLSSTAGAGAQPQVLDDSDPLKPLVSQWGADPLRASAGTNGLLAPENFTNAVTSTRDDIEFKTTALSLDELSGGTNVSVSPHAVSYDAARRLWYCDIEIDPGQSYYPFVRLALARYQPNSVDGAHLSRVVLADFVQLAPERTVSITAVAGAPSLRNVTVAGPSYTHFKGLNTATQLYEVTPRSTVMGVTLETQAIADDAGWIIQEVFPLTHDASQQLWSGQIELKPIPGTPGAKPMRLVIREIEAFNVAEDLEQSRIVYADVVNL